MNPKVKEIKNEIAKKLGLKKCSCLFENGRRISPKCFDCQELDSLYVKYFRMQAE